MQVSPWSGQAGYLCLPLAKNIKQGIRGAKKVKCDQCGNVCLISKEAEKLLESNKDKLKGVCTECALRNGTK